MKHLISILVILITASTIFAQSDDSLSIPEREFLPKPKDFGATVNVNGLIGNISGNPRQDMRGVSTVMFRYVITDGITYRLGIAPNIMSARVMRNDSVGKDLVEYDSTARQSAVSISNGLEFHFKGSKRLDPYIALDAEAGIIGQLKAGAKTDVSDTTGTSKFNRTITEAGGFSLGSKLSLGANYFVAKRLAIGAEYGVGIHYFATGGDRQDVLQIEPTSGAPSTIRVRSSARTVNTQFFVDPTVQLTLSYYFSL